MLKKTITYTDFDGNSRTEDFYFNYSKAELAEMELSYEGGMKAMLESLAASNDRKKIVAVFKEIILGSYGVKSPDGKRFVKSEALREEFYQSEAYSELFMEIASNTESLTAFVNGIIPKIN